MATKTTEPKNWTYLAGRTIAGGFLVGALAASYTHIVHLSNMGHLYGWQSWTAPIFIDGFAILGRLARSKNFADSTRKTGRNVQIAATSVSFIANVIAGETIGAQIFGALVVIGYVVAEMLAERMHPAATKAETDKAAASDRAKRAAATRAANKADAERKAAERKERTRLARLAREAELKAAADGRFPAGDVPVSPAPSIGYL
jgi:signal transduction histidine kinase